MNRQAFSLVEVMVSLAIFSGLFLVLSAILVSGNQIYSGVMSTMELRQSARNAMDRIVREVRESNSSTVSIDPNHSNSSILSFYGPRFRDTNGAFQPIKYSLINGKIMREFPPGTSTPVAIDVTQLYFSPGDPQTPADPRLQILIRVGKTVNNRLMEFSLKQIVRMRNE